MGERLAWVKCRLCMKSITRTHLAPAARALILAAIGDRPGSRIVESGEGTIVRDERYRRGVEIQQRLSGGRPEQIANRIAEIAPDFARMTIEFPLGDLYSRGALDLRTRELATIAMLASLGRMPQLRIHVGAALNIGCACEEVVEILMQTAIYAGFPAALDALAQCHDLLAGPQVIDES
jgi:4-carboxymuconolactone decarboxylase